MRCTCTCCWWSSLGGNPAPCDSWRVAAWPPGCCRTPSTRCTGRARPHHESSGAWSWLSSPASVDHRGDTQKVSPLNAERRKEERRILFISLIIVIFSPLPLRHIFLHLEWNKVQLKWSRSRLKTVTCTSRWVSRSSLVVYWCNAIVSRAPPHHHETIKVSVGKLPEHQTQAQNAFSKRCLSIIVHFKTQCHKILFDRMYWLSESLTL